MPFSLREGDTAWSKPLALLFAISIAFHAATRSAQAGPGDGPTKWRNGRSVGKSPAAGMGTATVECVETIAISEATVGWVKLGLPASGTADYTLSWSSGLVTLTGGTSSVSASSSGGSAGRSGAWVVTGTPDAPFSFSISIGAFSGTGITLQAAHVNGTSDSETGYLGAGGTFTLKAGGVIRVDPTAGPGAHTATAIVTVNYT